ncbi:MAG: CPBP family intramembrane metalloprotease [Gemmataceae bacterium]|nr:CPBP family intramembrane metalloprotease [Gemmataceae bacterium]
MNDTPELPLDTAIQPGEPQPPPRRWPWLCVLLAWLVIGAGAVWQAAGRYVLGEAPRREADAEDLNRLTVRTQGRYYLGARELLGLPEIYEQAKGLNTGPVSQRLRAMVLAGDMAGPAEALARLRALDEAVERDRVQYTPAQRAVRDILERLYRDYAALRLDAPSVSPQDRAQLRTELDWFGELALAPAKLPAPPARLVLPAAGGPAAAALRDVPTPDPQARKQVTAPALTTFLGLVLLFIAGVLVALAGLVGLIVFLVLVFRGVVRSALRCGAAHGGVYAETFAVWFVLFAGLSFAGALLPRDGLSALLGGAVALLSLTALGWPVLRGVPWKQVREDVGLTAGRGPVIEGMCGIASYAMALPLLAVGVLITLLLVALHGQATGAGGDSFRLPATPAHPAALEVAQGDVWVRLQVLFLACVVAPVVEEIMFRGVLYRHLREGTCRLGTGWSFILSALLVSFVFAVIHPQGMLGAPPLMALACGFALAREWRGTLLPAMVGHALNNGAVMLVVILAFGD